jgi:hypothetical protein
MGASGSSLKSRTRARSASSSGGGSSPSSSARRAEVDEGRARQLPRGLPSEEEILDRVAVALEPVRGNPREAGIEKGNERAPLAERAENGQRVGAPPTRLEREREVRTFELQAGAEVSLQAERFVRPALQPDSPPTSTGSAPSVSKRTI